MKKKLLLALLPVMCLTSCGDEGYFGTYKFMLGKQGDPSSQVGVSANLTNDDYSYKVFYHIAATVEDHAALEAYDKTKLEDLDVIKVQNDTDGIYHYHQFIKATSDYEDKGQERPFKTTIKVDDAKKFDIDFSIGTALADLPQDIALAIYKGIAGYYKQTSFTDEKYGTRISLGTLMTEEGIKGIEYIYDYIASQTDRLVADLVRSFIEKNNTFITPDFIEYIITAYVKTNALTIKVPVSFDDLQHQLSWYGKYIDLDPDVKEKIHGIKDVVSNLVDVIKGFKYAELSEKHKIVIDNKTNTFVNGETISMPGKYTGEARFGTLPNTSKNADTGYSEIDYMNLYYASDFSNTFAYNNSKDNSIIGKFSKWETKVGQDLKTLYYFYDSNSTWKVTPSTTSVDATLYVESETMTSYKVPTDVTINFGSIDLFDSYLGINVANVVDKTTGKAISFDRFYKSPFEFRNYHTLPLALSKK